MIISGNAPSEARHRQGVRRLRATPCAATPLPSLILIVAALAPGSTRRTYGDGAKGGRPPSDPVAMFKVLILAAQNTVSDARMEFLIRDRLSWLRFLGFDLGAPTPDENTIRLFREKLTRAGALEALFAAFDRQLRERGYLPMGGQIVDATLVAAPNSATPRPRRRRSRRARARRKSGRTNQRRPRRRTPTRAGR